MVRYKLILSRTWFLHCVLTALYYSSDTLDEYLHYNVNTLASLPLDVLLPRISFCTKIEWSLKHNYTGNTLDFIETIRLYGNSSSSEFYKHGMHCISLLPSSEIDESIQLEIRHYKSDARFYVHDRETLPFGLDDDDQLLNI